MSLNYEACLEGVTCVAVVASEAQSESRVVSKYPRTWESGEAGGRRADGVSAARSYFYFMSS